jgi:hypothetical protein
MSKIFVHIINNNFKIDDFTCKASELKGIVEIPEFDSKYFELQYNEDKLLPNYVKYMVGNDVYIQLIPENILAFCKDFVINKDKYIDEIKQKQQEILEQQI